MRMQPRRHSLPQIRLQLEVFEWRHLLSGIPSLLPSPPSASLLAAPLEGLGNQTASSSITASSPTDHAQPQSSGTSCAVPVSSLAVGDVLRGTAAPSDPGSFPPATVAVMATGSETPSASNPPKAAGAVNTSVEVVGSASVDGRLMDAATAMPIKAVSIQDGQGDNYGTVTGSTGQSDPSLGTDSSAPAGAAAEGGSQSPRDANTGTPSTAGSPATSAAQDAQQDANSSAPNMNSAAASQMARVTPDAGSSSGSAGRGQQNVPLGSSAAILVAPNGPAGAHAPAPVASSRIVSTTADGRPTSASSGSPASSQISSRGHTNSDANAPAPPSNTSTHVSNETRTDQSSPGSERLSSMADQSSASDNRSYRSDSNSVAATGARHVSAPELIATDLVFAEREQPGRMNPQARSSGRPQAEEAVSVLGKDEGEEKAANAVARGAGLLGSPLTFDVDVLAREAQEFFEQIDYLRQDLASLLAQIHLPPWCIAVTAAATSFAVVHRRSRHRQRDLALKSGMGTAFAYYPELGGLSSWEAR